MKLSWVVQKSNIENTKKLIMESMEKSDMPSFVKTQWEQNELSVKVDKNGKSEFRLSFLADGDSVKITETKRSVALFHKPFVGRVESFLTKLMEDCGAKMI